MTPDSSQQSHDKKNKLQDRSKLRRAQSLVSTADERLPTIPLMRILGSLILFVKLNLFFNQKDRVVGINPGL